MLKSISISGFRSCRETNLVFDRGLTCLIGKNGAGKTNILRAIEWFASMASGHKESIQEDPLHYPTMRVDATCELGNKTFAYSVELHAARAPGSQPTIATETLSEASSVSTTVIFHRTTSELALNSRPSSIGNPPPGTPTIAFLNAFLPQDDPSHAMIRPLSEFLKRVSYYKIAALIQDNNYLVFDHAYDKWLQEQRSGLGDNDSNLCMRLVHLFKTDKSGLQNLNQMMGPLALDLLKRIEVLELSIPASSGTSPAATQVYLIRFYPSDRMGGAGQPLAVSQLSDGTRSVLRILLAIFFDDRSVLLFEEPEDSLHHGLLAGVIDIVRANADSFQFVFSTHSRGILDLMLPSEVRMIFAREGNTECRSLDATESSAAIRYLSREGNLSDFMKVIEDS